MRANQNVLIEAARIRYFILYENCSITPLVLFRFDPSKWIEESWFKTRWNASDKVLKYLTGEEWLDDEIDEAVARQTFPSAFKALEERITT